MEKVLISCSINGKPTTALVDPRASLSDMLRGDYRLTGVKKGCEVGECGACSVIINGEVYNSCIYLAIWAKGKEITTIEGITPKDGTLSEMQQAFLDEGAVQCGFCSPGFVITATNMQNSKKEYTKQEIKRELSGNMCRCTGYENIVKAVDKVLNK